MRECVEGMADYSADLTIVEMKLAVEMEAAVDLHTAVKLMNGM